MIQVTYTSVATGKIGSADVFKIVEASAKNNAVNGLSGFLIFTGGRFFQLLEGPEAAVDALLAKLAKDSRHASLEVLTRAPVEERLFTKWKMKRLALTRHQPSIIHDVPEFRRASQSVKNALDGFLNPALSLSA